MPVFDRVRTLVWMKAAMQGIGPALIGVVSVSLAQMMPHALPDPFAIAIFIATAIALLKWRIDAIKLILAGAVVGLVWSHLSSLPGVGQTLFLSAIDCALRDAGSAAAGT
jgi:chromate transport protein ChrA